MISVDRGSRLRRAACRILVVICLLAGPGAAVQGSDAGPEVWLVTYGPGQIYWQRFGHNAIWIRDEDLGLDHTFNFGFFDFAQEDFILRFLQGRMLYFSAAQPAATEFGQYMNENRSIRAQRLDLTADQALSLAGFLVNEVQPENRDYLYDYYLDNCSTRVRDALDMALGGRLREAFGHIEGGQSFRGHTRRLTEPAFWLYLGLELGLGSPVDRAISRWEEFFIPGELADGMAELAPGSSTTGSGVVIEDVVIHASSAPQPPASPGRTWPRYLLASLALLVVCAVLTRVFRRLTSGRLARAWLLLSGIAGCALLFFWFGTDHAAASRNMNLLVFNPLWLLVYLGRPAFRPVGALIALSGVAAVAAPFVPPHQFTADVLAAFLPLNIAAAAALFRAARAAEGARLA